MAFVNYDSEKITGNKQHLNLSRTAFEVVSEDMFTFGEEKLSGFINTVFENFYPFADASVSLRLNHQLGELEEILSGVPGGDERTKNRIVDRLQARRREIMALKSRSYDGGCSFKIWLNKRNMEYLTDENSECGEEAYYSRRGEYVKSVIEEYARLPYVERELIYYDKIVAEIRRAIRDRKMLKVVAGNNKTFSVYPYKLLCDPLSTANYLVGYSRPYGSPEKEKIPCSFRISAAVSVKCERSKSAFLKEIERESLAQTVSTRGVQFMIGNESEIRVRFTDEGLYQYGRRVHLRPHIAEKIDDRTFAFNCTTTQAEFYFFKFGADAEILHPESLREKFKRMYQAAAEVYGE